MPHYNIQADADGKIQQIFKDGEAFSGSVALETPDAIVRIYYESAAQSLQRMATQADSLIRRSLGLQSFLMSLTGLEAFANTFFHLRALELQNDNMVRRISQKHGSLSQKISDLIGISNDGPLIQQQELINKISELSQLRNEIVHPRWQPASMTLHNIGIPISFHGLAQNFQAVFENVDFCKAAYLHCLLLPARYSQALGHDDISGFMFRWCSRYQTSMNQLLEELDATKKAP
jgi:hypothetical protein